MGKGKNYKNFPFNKKEDYLYAAKILIVRTYSALKKYKFYRDKLQEEVDRIIANKIEYIDVSYYEEWEDKQKNVSHNLLTCFIDDTSTGFSYVMFRKLVNRSEYKDALYELDIETKGYLEELRDVRNWTFHFAQSDFVAIKEVMYKGINEDLQKYITFSGTPIIIDFPQLVSGKFMQSLFLHMSKRIRVFDKLFDCMLMDYQNLLGQEVEIIEAVASPMEYGGPDFMTAQLSMAMQKKRYDGTKESFERAISLNGL